MTSNPTTDHTPSLAELEIRSELFDAMDGNLRMSKRHKLLDAYREAVLAAAPAVFPEPPSRAAEERLGEELDAAAATIAELTVQNRRLEDELRRLAAEAQQQPETEAHCSCGGTFPLNHLHADTHEPAPVAQQPAAADSEETRPGICELPHLTIAEEDACAQEQTP